MIADERMNTNVNYIYFYEQLSKYGIDYTDKDKNKDIDPLLKPKFDYLVEANKDYFDPDKLEWILNVKSRREAEKRKSLLKGFHTRCEDARLVEKLGWEEHFKEENMYKKWRAILEDCQKQKEVSA